MVGYGEAGLRLHYNRRRHLTGRGVQWLEASKIKNLEVFNMEKRNIFAVEFEGNHYHLGCAPQNERLHKDDIILRDDADENEIYFCEECGEQIV